MRHANLQQSERGENRHLHGARLKRTRFGAEQRRPLLLTQLGIDQPLPALQAPSGGAQPCHRRIKRYWYFFGLALVFHYVPSAMA
ncbi:hypothetical protein RQP53_12460 [Paucibacter sp. APW11]|uniref:Uncharacterized protein n=1 Tax=Roseateles aquae TaxID=3077235 RepID=A0ABU3PCQ6_9BURK|nr:hypothetical protein [Paucibacter sp. APW11]MDT9000080.1 hypothetical protein [Paucibacter sp. APW11]